MKNSQLYIAAIVLGVIALIVAILFFANVLGTHHLLPYVALIVGIVLILIGVGGMVMRSRGPA